MGRQDAGPTILTAHPDGRPYNLDGPSRQQVLRPDGLSYDGRSVRMQDQPPGRPARTARQDGRRTVMMAHPDGTPYDRDGPSGRQFLCPDGLS